MNNLVDDFQQELANLEALLISAGEWKEGNVVRDKLGQFAKKTGQAVDSAKSQVGKAAQGVKDKAQQGMDSVKKEVGDLAEGVKDKAQQGMDSVKKEVGDLAEGVKDKAEEIAAKFPGAEIQKAFESLKTSMQSNLTKAVDAGGAKLAEFSQSPQVKKVKAQAEELAKNLGDEAKKSYDKVESSINQGLAEISKKIPPEAKDKAKQIKDATDKIMQQVQDVITTAKDPHYATAGAAIAMSMFNAVAGSLSSQIQTPEGRDKLMKQGVKALDSPDFQKGVADAKSLMQEFKSALSDKEASDNVQDAIVDLIKQAEPAKKTGKQELQDVGKRLTNYVKK